MGTTGQTGPPTAEEGHSSQTDALRRGLEDIAAGRRETGEVGRDQVPSHARFPAAFWPASWAAVGGDPG